jgi:hypothetical protein
VKFETHGMAKGLRDAIGSLFLRGLCRISGHHVWIPNSKYILWPESVGKECVVCGLIRYAEKDSPLWEKF